MSGYAAKVLAAQPPTYVVFDTAIRDTAASHEEEFRELAAFIGCATAEIEGTLAAARAAAAGERSNEFGRTDFGNGPLRPPYAIGRTVPGLFHTQGGLRVDEDARVQRPDRSVIAG